jgi:negative regulator of flagellin synthesis FlgM
MINGIKPQVTPPPRELRPSGVVVGEPMAKTKAVERDATAAPNPAGDLAAAGPPVDTGRVAAIRAAIENGTYQVDPEAIAGRMIDLDLPPAR